MLESIFSVGILTAGCFFLSRDGKRLSRINRNSLHNPVTGILRRTKTNNTYPPLLDVLSSLKSDLDKQGIILHADMKGYMSNG